MNFPMEFSRRKNYVFVLGSHNKNLVALGAWFKPTNKVKTILELDVTTNNRIIFSIQNSEFINKHGWLLELFQVWNLIQSRWIWILRKLSTILCTNNAGSVKLVNNQPLQTHMGELNLRAGSLKFQNVKCDEQKRSSFLRIYFTQSKFVHITWGGFKSVS